MLQAPEIGRFSQVKTLVNQPLSVVYRAVAAFFADRKLDDLLLLYFSGHRVLDQQGRLFLAVKQTQRRILSGTALPASFISDQMDGTRAKRPVLILDCRNSGAFSRGTKGVTGASVGVAAAFESNGFGPLILTPCQVKL